MAIRRKKESSLVKAMYMVKNKEADAFVSAGSSGAILVGGQTIVGRLRGVDRPPMAALIPTKDGVSLLVDSGANVDARATMLVQWAVMGSIYMENVVGIKNPRVAIVNVGLEEEKGNSLVKETYPMLKECPNINFIGSIEAREIPNSYADIIVCDAFVGNCILKLYEGEAKMILGKIKGVMMSSLKTKIGALLIKKVLKTQLKSMDASEHGGAPLIGLNGLVVKTHGNTKAKEVKNSLIQCVTFTKMNINDKICKIVLYHHGMNPLTLEPIPRCEDKEILKYAKMLHTIDVYEALTSSRIYRNSFSQKEAINIMEKEANYDNQVMDFLQNIRI